MKPAKNFLSIEPSVTVTTVVTPQVVPASVATAVVTPLPSKSEDQKSKDDHKYTGTPVTVLAESGCTNDKAAQDDEVASACILAPVSAAVAAVAQPSPKLQDHTNCDYKHSAAGLTNLKATSSERQSNDEEDERMENLLREIEQPRSELSDFHGGSRSRRVMMSPFLLKQLFFEAQSSSNSSGATVADTKTKSRVKSEDTEVPINRFWASVKVDFYESQSSSRASTRSNLPNNETHSDNDKALGAAAESQSLSGAVMSGTTSSRLNP